MRKAFIWSHRWFGLIAGLHFVLLGLSGSFLVYSGYFQGLLDPTLFRSSVETKSFSLVEIIESAQMGLGVEGSPKTVYIPESPNANAIVTFGAGSGSKDVSAFVDLSGYRYKGSELFDESAASKIYEFHENIFLGSLGRTLNAVSGILIVVILFSGICIWWPRAANFRRAFRMRNLETFFIANYEFHRLVGLYTALLTVMVALTGIVIARPDLFGGGREASVEAASEKPGAFDLRAVNTLMAQKSLLVRGIYLEFGVNKISLSHFRGAEDPDKFEIDPGVMKLSSISAEASPKRNFKDFNLALHSGAIWGKPGGLLLFIAGLLPMLLYFSGAYIWWKKNFQRTRQKKDYAWMKI